MHPRLLTSLPVIAVLAAALVAAPWPDGDVMGRDRELVARLTRGGLQRLDADADHGVYDAAEHAVAAVPVTHPPGLGLAVAAWSAAFAALPGSAPALTPPATSRLDVDGASPSLPPAPPTRLARARAPPAA